MPTKIKNDDGTETEVFTQAEIDAKLSEVTKTFEAKIADQTTILNKSLEEKKALEVKLASANPQEANFKILKEALDKKDGEIAAMNKSIQDSEEARVNDYRNEILAKYAQGDKELEKKILHHFNETLKSVPAKTKEEIVEKMKSAAKLSVDPANPGVLSSVLSGAGGPGFVPNSGSGPVEFTAAEKALGAKLGITEEDYKKFGPRLKNKK